MDEEMYPDAGESSDSKPEMPDKGMDHEESDQYEGHTELVSKKLLGLDEDAEVKPGQEFILEVVKSYGKEVELKYSPKKEKKSPSEMSADDELDGIDSASKPMASMSGKGY